MPACLGAVRLARGHARMMACHACCVGRRLQAGPPRMRARRTLSKRRRPEKNLWHVLHFPPCNADAAQA